jgi:TolB-like protein/Tfp pilus assembly protein PilF
VTDSGRAVFLSYASQDVEAAARICAALRASGIEVWFDQSELRGGDAWDQSIRRQIKTCALFVPVISNTTHERAEGYFRLEWKLAVDRSHLIAADKAFLIPVVVDDTRDDDERVPEKFREVQWTRLPLGETPTEFVRRIQQLLAGATKSSPMAARGPAAVASGNPSPLKLASLAVAIVLAVVVCYVLVEKPWVTKSVAFVPPPHSIAVLPFVNMSGDKEQEYFSDGLTEELLNSLSRINELQVSARTSSFSFKGKDTDLSTLAHKLNVASVLEGSVRRAGNTLRITAQLNNAITGFQLWSQTYDRNLSDVLQLQTEIANAVAAALKITLLGDVTAKIEVGATHNPEAFDAYLRATKAYRGALDRQGLEDSIAGYTEAVHIDPNYAIPYADRSIALSDFARNWGTGDAIRDYRERSQLDARKAIALAPDLANGHLALAALLENALDFAGATKEYERALALAPGSARVLRQYAIFASQMGRIEAALAAAHQAVALDPLNADRYLALGLVEFAARRNSESLASLKTAGTLSPNHRGIDAWLAFAYYASGDYPDALAACENADESNKLICLPMIYNKLGRHSEAQASLVKYQAERGEEGALFFAMIYAQWGDHPRALDWLDTAMRMHDPYLEKLKTNVNFDPLRKEPRFQAIERQLKFPA